MLPNGFPGIPTPGSDVLWQYFFEKVGEAVIEAAKRVPRRRRTAAGSIQGPLSPSLSRFDVQELREQIFDGEVSWLDQNIHVEGVFFPGLLLRPGWWQSGNINARPAAPSGLARARILSMGSLLGLRHLPATARPC